MSSPSTFDMQECIRALVACSPRQLAGEIRALQLILSILDKNDVAYELQQYTTFIPVAERAELFCDGKRVSAEACSFVSGRITGKGTIFSAIADGENIELPNISFNPYCASVSPGSHYFAPALAVSHKSLQRILTAKKVRGSVKIQKKRHRSTNILIGNTASPQAICFTHYDSIKKGAIDNASGVSVTLKSIFAHPALLQTCLFVIAGNEELSYDRPLYWGHGYQAFREQNEMLYSQAATIIVVDSVGNGQPCTLTDPNVVQLAFPLARKKAAGQSVMLLTGDFEHLMTVYHSDLDDGRGIEQRYLDRTVRALVRLLTRASS